MNERQIEIIKIIMILPISVFVLITGFQNGIIPFTVLGMVGIGVSVFLTLCLITLWNSYNQKDNKSNER